MQWLSLKQVTPLTYPHGCNSGFSIGLEGVHLS